MEPQNMQAKAVKRLGLFAYNVQVVDRTSKAVDSFIFGTEADFDER